MVLALTPAILNAPRKRIFFMKERFLPSGFISNELFKKHCGKVLIDLAGLLVLITIPFPQSFCFTLDFFCTLFAKLTL